jgi:hypothetical protein
VRQTIRAAKQLVAGASSPAARKQPGRLSMTGILRGTDCRWPVSEQLRKATEGLRDLAFQLALLSYSSPGGAAEKTEKAQCRGWPSSAHLRDLRGERSWGVPVACVLRMLLVLFAA